jgi:hypothetical protein
MSEKYTKALERARTELPCEHPLVSHIERHSDIGPGHFFYVRLPDGHLLDCGTDKFRALAVACLLED